MDNSIINFENCKQIAKRTKYKTITDDYVHFIFQSYRIETVNINGYFVTCIVKCGSPRKSNTSSEFKKIIYIGSKDNEIVYDKNEYASLILQLVDFINAHNNLYKSLSLKGDDNNG